MAITSGNTIKQGDASITPVIREYFRQGIMDQVYEQSISRNLPEAVDYVINHSATFSNKYEWTKSSGITTSASDRFDVASTDLKLPVVEYATTKDSIEATKKGGVVSINEDVLMDQESYVAGNIQTSLVEDLLSKENDMFSAVIMAGTAVAGTSATVDMTTVTLRLGVNQMRVATADRGVAKYMLMHPSQTQKIAAELGDASKIGDNGFLRENVIGRLHKCNVIETTYVPVNKVVYLGNDSLVFFERMPYTLAISQDEVDDTFYKFAIKARFNMKVKRASRVLVATFKP